MLFALYFLLMVVSPGGGGLGFGDVKLAIVLGMLLGWVGWGPVIVSVMAAFVLGGLVSVVLLALRRVSRQSSIAFGPAMIAGAWVALVLPGPGDGRRVVARTARGRIPAMLRWLTAGESHGPALVAMIEGLPAGVEVTSADVAAALARRRLGYGRGARMKFERDEVEFLGGVRHGVTLGSPGRHPDRQHRVAQVADRDEPRPGGRRRARGRGRRGRRRRRWPATGR